MSFVHCGREVVCCDLTVSCRLRASSACSEAGHLCSSVDCFFILSRFLGICAFPFDRQIEAVLVH